MRSFNTFVTVMLYCTCRSVFALNCDATFLSNANIPTVGPPTVSYLQTGTTITLPTVAGCPTSFVATTNMCRVTMNISTSSRSGIYMEVWMPDNWDGRYISTGNFGLTGCVKYDDLQYLSSLQIAVGGADGGHAGNSGESFAGNLDAVKDFSFRSVHTMTTIAKQVVNLYYNFTPKKSYYYGCSTGGRQGLQSAQMFPDDFDGIIASSAAVDFNNLVGWTGSFFIITGPPGSPTFLTDTQWNTVHAAIMQTCDSIDGVTDGVIEDPNLCNFNPQTLLCGANSGDTTCLTNTQVGTVSRVFSALRDTNGKLLYPQMQPGSEQDAAVFYYSGQANDVSTQWYQNAIFDNKGFDPASLSINDITLGDNLDLATISSFSGDLSAFQNRGGKLITSHGLADPLITSTGSERYYKHVSATMNLPPTSLDAFYRYFRISGMGHCNGGNGPWEIGQTSSDVPATAQQNIVYALFDWVENGVAPDTLLGTKFVNDMKASGVQFQRNHCRYPYRTTYTGGDSTKPGAWTCKAIVDPSAVMAEET